MHVKQKLVAILNRIRYYSDHDVKQNYGPQYQKGFDHAVKLFDVVIDKQMGDYVQISINTHQRIKEQKRTIENLSEKITTHVNHIKRLEAINARLEMSLASSVTGLSNTKKKRILRGISEMTGQPYWFVREQFNSIIEKNGGKNG